METVICMGCLKDFVKGTGTGICVNAFCTQDCEDNYCRAAVKSLDAVQLAAIHSKLANHRSQDHGYRDHMNRVSPAARNRKTTARAKVRAAIWGNA